MHVVILVHLPRIEGPLNGMKFEGVLLGKHEQQLGYPNYPNTSI